MTDRWSEENIAAKRVENLQKARDVLKMKREANLRLPFTVTPVLPEADIVIPTPKTIEEKTYGSLARDKIYDLSYTVLYSLSSIAVALAVPVVVGYLRDTILLPSRQPVHSPSDREEAVRYNGTPYSGDIIFRKV